MPDFMLEPDALEPERLEHRAARQVSTGLAPTAEVPTKRREKESPPCYGPCPDCGTPVLAGRTAAGERIVVDPAQLIYTVYWANGAPEPILTRSPSQGY